MLDEVLGPIILLIGALIGVGYFKWAGDRLEARLDAREKEKRRAE
jgi:hypothetical protein